MALDYLCGCTNCMTILLDEDPNKGAVQQEVPANAEKMVWSIDTEDCDAEVGDDEVWCCPNCMTEQYLTSNLTNFGI